MLELIPYFSAITLLLTAFFVIRKTGHPILGFVTAILPAINLTIDTFIGGNQTKFRAIFGIVYAMCLVWVMVYNIKRKKL